MNHTSRPKYASLFSALFLLFASMSSLQAGSPDLVTIFPGGAQRGTEVDVVCAGARLADVRSLLFTQPGIEVLGVSEAEAGKFKAKLKIAPDARIGEYFFRVVTNSGISDMRLFFVTPFPLQSEAEEDKENPVKPQTVPVNVSLYGATKGQDQDHFEVEMQKGQRLAVEVVGIRFSTQQAYDPHLSILKPDGSVLAELDDCSFTLQDPAMSVIIPEDGKYRVVIRESTNNGEAGGESACRYLLHIGNYPRPLMAYPLGGPAGAELTVQMLGDAAGAFEQKFTLPGVPDKIHPAVAEKEGLLAPQANALWVSAFPNVLEVEPNNQWDKATPTALPLPVAFNGIISEKEDNDWFKFTAKKDETFDFQVIARSVQSPLDSILTIANSTGAEIAANDDGGAPDSAITWKAPADGDYFVSVRDQLKRGGPLFVYRLEMSAPRARLQAYLPEIVLNNNQARRDVPVPKGNRYGALVRIKRVNVAGAVAFDTVGLPAGVTATFANMDKELDTIAMVFEATPDATPAQGLFTTMPRLAEPPPESKTSSEIKHRIEVTENGNRRPYYVIEDSTFPIAVTEEAPAKIEIIQPKVPVLQNGSLPLKVVVTRHGDFKGPVNAQLLYVPPEIGSPGIVAIPEGQTEGVLSISATAKAPAGRKSKTSIVATVDAGKGPIWISTAMFEIEVGESPVTGKFQRSFVDQGAEENMTLKLEQKVPFEGKATITLSNLPTGVTSEPREITKDDKEVKFPVKATADAQVGQHKQVMATFTLVKDGETMTNTIASGGVLRVDKATATAAAK